MIRRLGILAAAIGLMAAAPATLTGPVHVVDGDTFSLGAERVASGASMRRRGGRFVRAPRGETTLAATLPVTSSFA